ncbi:MAG: putative DNA binding protein, partial [halophilic archaeon J07HX5]
MRARHRSSGSVIGLHDRSVHASGTTVLKEAVERSAPALIVLTLYSCVVHACSRLPGRTTTAPTRPRQLPRDPTERPSRACYTAVRRTRLLCPGDCVPPDPRQEKTRERQDTQHEQQYRCEDDNRAERADNDTDLYEFVQSSLTIEFPATVVNGWYEFTRTGTREELDWFQAALNEQSRAYELRSLVRTTETDGLLTDRQCEILEAAAQAGCFEVPRQSTLADVAAGLDVDKSTAS